MFRNEHRIDAKRRNTLNHKKQQFAAPSFKSQDYPHRLNLYTIPPTEDITLEQLSVQVPHHLFALAINDLADGLQRNLGHRSIKKFDFPNCFRRTICLTNPSLSRTRSLLVSQQDAIGNCCSHLPSSSKSAPSPIQHFGV